MFNKKLFSDILTKIYKTYNNQRDFAEAAEVNRAYLSQYINMKLDNPPTPKILARIANASKGITDYEELMIVCGHYEATIESTVYEIYTKLKELSKQIHKQKNIDLYETESAIETFQEYSTSLIETLERKEFSPIFLTDYYRKEFLLDDYNFVCTFLFLYDSFLQCLIKENYIAVNNYQFINWFDFEALYNKVVNLPDIELFSYNSQTVNITTNSLEDLCNYIKSFSTALNLSYLSDFDSNTLIDLFKQNVKISDSNNNKTIEKEITNTQNLSSDYYMCPVYGQISAGIPNWAEECIEGRLPIDPVLFNIINPEEHFFLRVNGESMNKVIRNGAYALIHKQDIVENGEIAVVLVNGYEATLKKFTKYGDVIVLEPMSDDNTFKTQIYNKDTPIQVLGKYIGKFEMNS